IRCGGQSSMRRPASVRRPAVGRSVPAIRLNRVVLPAPFGPISPVTVPAPTANETSSTARTPPKRLTSPVPTSRGGAAAGGSAVRAWTVGMVGFLAVARQTDNSFRIAAGTMTMPQTDRDAGGLGRDALAEVEALHRFFEAWMGSGAQDETAFERCRAALAPGFVMVGPDGALHGRDAVLQRVRTAQHAHLDADRPFRLWIEEAAVLYVEAPL